MHTATPTPVFAAEPETSYAQYLLRERGDVLDIATRIGPDGILDAIDESGLQGRGGAWFPAAEKWRTTRAHAEDELVRSGVAPVVVVNAAEGEPGSFKDRWLLRRHAFAVVEGAIIAAAVVGADTIVFAVKQSFRREREILVAAIEAVAAAGRTSLPELLVLDGPERYLFGEETALLEVVAGRPPFPRLSPPWRHGALDLGDEGAPAATPLATESADAPAPPPSIVHNVETLARVARIIRDTAIDDVDPARGASTFLATLTGHVRVPRVEEFPLGISLRALLDDDGRDVGAVLNGVSYPIIPPERFDEVLADPREADDALPIGAAAFQIFPDTVPRRAIAAAAARFLSIESCGQCEPCKTEGREIAVALSSGPTGDAVELSRRLVDHAARVTEGARCGLAGQQRDLVDGLLAHFPDALVADGDATGGDPLDDSPPSVELGPVRSIDDGHVEIDRAYEELQPDWSSDSTWSGGWPAAVIDTAQAES